MIQYPYHSAFTPCMLLLAWVTLANAVPAQTEVFFLHAPRAFPTALASYGIAVGDFNHDGLEDLVTADPGDSDVAGRTVSVLLGRGDGTFLPARDHQVGFRPKVVRVGDFDSDGNLDLAVIADFSLTIWTLLGLGDGTFRAGPNLTVPGPARFMSLAVDDLNGDGLPDLVCSAGGVSVLIARGDGTFEPAQSLGVTGDPHTVTVGDFNNDGIRDIASSSYSSSSIAVVLGEGPARFGPPRYYGVRSQPTAVAAGDFNTDGTPDLVVGHLTGLTLTLLLGDGAGMFKVAGDVASGARAITTGDLDGDGRLDLILTSGGVRTMLGNGDGTFQPAHSFDVAGVAGEAVARDFNRDGIPDVATANSIRDWGVEGTVSILLGRGDGTFFTPASFDAGTSASVITTGDFDRDGNLDLATAGAASVGVLMGNGDGTFQLRQTVAVGSAPASITGGDFNGDGEVDLVTANWTTHTVSVLIGRGDGTFEPARDFATGLYPRSLAVGDFNEDGALDLVTGSSVSGTPTTTIAMLVGRGDGTFYPPQETEAGWKPAHVSADDYNGDGHLDVAAANYERITITILLGNGDGTFNRSGDVTGLYDWPTALISGDFNGDGKADLATSHFFNALVTVLAGNGDGTFSSQRRYRVVATESRLQVGDFNGDTIQDLAVSGARTVGVLVGEGDGTFQAGQYFGGGGSGIAVGDYNGDERPDVAGAGGLRVSILINITGMEEAKKWAQ